jgi:OOP family OmpA-OmpF porin
MKLRSGVTAITWLAIPVLAHAQPVTGPYIAASVGTSINHATNVSFVQERITGKYQFRPDYAGFAGVGFGFGDGLRIEIDGDYARNTLHAADLDGIGHLRASGAEQKYGPMANVFYDFSIGLPIYPYLGGGAGYQFVLYNRDLAIGTGDGTYIKTTGTDGSFGYDVIAGASYPLPWVPGLSITAEYRFMQLVQSHSYYSYADLGRGPQPFSKARSGPESTHTILLGLRYQLFNPPPPVQVPASAPITPISAPALAPAKTYLVFFDWDRSSLTPRALNIVSQAALDSKSAQTTTIKVSGYTDTSGTPTYNMGLSARRARAVADQLVADGVPANEIETHAFGETHLLVPTGPGVREPQNRRVEIVLQ